MRMTYTDFHATLQSVNEVTLGQMLEMAGYKPTRLAKWLDQLMDYDDMKDMVQLDLCQPDVPELDAVWDGAVYWDAEHGEFQYHGMNGPCGGNAPVHCVLNTASKFQVL